MTTKTCGSGGDYTDLTDWEANELGTASFTEDMIGQIIGEIIDECTLSGFTTNGHNVIIEPNSGEGTPAFATTDALVYNASMGGAVRGTTNSGTSHVINQQFTTDKLIVRDIQAYKNANSGQTLNTTANATIDTTRCIFKGGQLNSNLWVTHQITLVSTNCLYAVVSGARLAALINKNGTNITFINNTFINESGAGAEALLINNFSTVKYSQSLFLGFTDAHVNNAGSPTITGDYNILDNVSGGLQGANSDDSVTGSNEITSEYTDMRLKSGATSDGFIPAASADAATPSDDIIGQTRSGDVDCGCWDLASGGGGTTGTIAQSLPAPSQAANANEAITGTVAQNVAPPVQALAGDEAITGTVAQNVAPPVQALAGDEVIAGTAAQILAPATQAANGTAVVNATGTIAQALAPATQAASGTHTLNVSGTIGQTLAALTQAAAGSETVGGAVAQTLAALTQAAAAAEKFVATIAQTLAAALQALAGTARLEASAAQTLPPAVQAAAASATLSYSGAIAATLPALVQALAGAQTVTTIQGFVALADAAAYSLAASDALAFSVDLTDSAAGTLTASDS